MAWALALVLTAAAGDLRIPLVELQLAGQPQATLAAAEQARVERPEEAADSGVSYLRGRLFQALGQPAAAEDAFEDALSETPELHPYVRYRLALAQEAMGHPEVAAGLIAGVVDRTVPEELLGPATELFARSIEGGGDCRVYRGVAARRLPDPQRRLLDVVGAVCTVRDGKPLDGGLQLCDLLEAGTDGDAAHWAAEAFHQLLRRESRLLDALAGRGCAPEYLVGMTFDQHRQFDLSIPYLERAVARFGGNRTVSGDRELDARYALARGYFWREQFSVAAARFGDLALRTRDLPERARVLYQQARSLELAGDWDGADAGFRRTYLTDRKGDLAGPALLSALRLEWRSGKEPSALQLLSVLGQIPEAREYTSRAYLFLAVSDLVRGRRDRADAWLDAAERLDRSSALEADYWRGRLAELAAESEPGAAERAVERYLAVALANPFHPLALDARARFARPSLAAAAAKQARRHAASGTPDDLLAAWLLRGDDSPEGRAARRALVAHYASAAATQEFYHLDRVPVASWPLWGRDLDSAPERLLALGLIDDGAEALRRQFDDGGPDLAYTGSRLLLDAHQVRAAMLFADSFTRALTRRVPEPALPPQVRTLLFPLAWEDRITAAAARFGTDPYLTAAILREESRFDPRALSTASARGLAQFVWLTARRLAAEVGLGEIRPADLYEPRVSITLASAYLAELQGLFDGSLPQAVAAYNAGPAQAQLWQLYCYSREMPEYFTKTGFAQTRAYLRKVLESRAQYQELYPDLAAAAAPAR
jgi:soluble lytic murein transglycosylase